MKSINGNQYNNTFYIDFENINNLSFSTPIYVKFSYIDEKRYCNNWTSVYVYVVKTLFNRHIEKLLSLKRTNITNGKRIDFGSKLQYDQMVSPKEIAHSFYVETNFNAGDIVKKIKALMDICNEKYSDLTIEYIVKNKTLSQSSTEKNKSDDNENNSKQVELIVHAIENAGGTAFYSEIYKQYSKLINKPITYIQQKIIDKILKENCAESDKSNGENIFCMVQKGSGVWKVTDEYKEKHIEKSANKVVKKFNKRAKTPQEKLQKRINREFDKVKYIGDIIINDEEYKILIDYLTSKLSSIKTLSQNTDDPLYAVALVQIGIREYNGRFWPHLSKITGIKIDTNQQRIVGERFYNTLIAHNKSHVDKGEIVNNILMHCFITKQYAPDFFEFMFAYYQHDLDRDLERHTKEMSDYLISCMKKAENSSRAFRIKKGTSDATTINERGCKRRIRNVLKYIDSYLFDNILPEDSPNRIAKYFCKWAKESTRFSKEKAIIFRNDGKRGKKNFRSPYLHFDSKNEQFNIVLPIQTVPLSDEEQTAELSWKISYNSMSKKIESETEDSVIGCRNIEIQFVSIEPKDIFSNIQIELIKNTSITVKKFIIPYDSVRFFDEDFDFVNRDSFSSETLYAFTKRDELIESDAYYETEHYLGLDIYSFQQLRKGNVIKKPDGKAFSIGNKFEEGLNYNYLINGANVLDNNDSYLLFNKAPSILVKMKNSEQTGTLITINNIKHRLKDDECIIFNKDNKDNNYILISLESYCNEDGIYNVIIDTPSNRNIKNYTFALIKNFEYKFINAPYIFRTNGTIKFNGSINVASINTSNNTYSFTITDETDKLNFSVNNFNVSIDVPIFKWKFYPDDKWSISEPEEIWHKELPDKFYFKLPSNEAFLFSKQDNTDEESKEKIHFNQNSNCFICDARRIRSWLDLGPALHNLCIRFADSDFKFLSVVTSCILVSCNLKNDVVNKKLILESTILGFSDCAVDILNNGTIIAEKLELTSNGVELETDKLFGEFDLIFYEYDDGEEDLFGFGEPSYSDFDRKTFQLENTKTLLGKKIFLEYITENAKSKSIFSADKYYIKDKLSVKIDSQDSENQNIYYGISNCANNIALSNLRIQIELLDLKDTSKALVFFKDESEECYVDFLFNKFTKNLELFENDKSQYLRFNEKTYYHISISKEK